MTKTCQDVIDEHVKELEKAEGIKITGFHLDYDKNISPEVLENELTSYRDKQELLRQIDPLTMAEAKIAHYESILRKIRQFGRMSISEWLEMPEPEKKLRHELFSMTDMGMWASMEHYIEFAQKKGVI